MRRGALALSIAALALPQGGAGLAGDSASGAIGQLAQIDHPYRQMALHALEQTQRRASGRAVRSAVLAEDVSLIEPRAVACGDKPFAVLIDLDVGAGDNMADPQLGGLGELLQGLRDAEIAVAWISERSEALLADELALLAAGEGAAFQKGDIELFGWSGLRKQQQRQNLAASHCVLAIAGDRKSDFDELFDYLRDPDYAIRLDAWMDKGWFLLPYPAAVAAANPSPNDTETDMTQ